MIQNKLRNDRGQVGIGTLIVFIALVLVAAIAAGVLINTAGFLQTQAEETGTESTDQVADNINVIGEVGSVVDAPLSGGGSDNVVYETRLTVQRSPGSNDLDLAELSIQYVGDNGFAQLIHVSDADQPGAISDDGAAGSVTTNYNEKIVNDPTTALESNERGQAAYLIEEITAASGSDTVLTDDGDRYEIVIPFGIMLDQAPESGSGSAIVLADGDLSEGSDTNDPTLSTIKSEINDVEDGSPGFDNGDLDTLEGGQTAEIELTTAAGATRNAVITAPDSLINEEGGTVAL